jgi:hypothetical protein
MSLTLDLLISPLQESLTTSLFLAKEDPLGSLDLSLDVKDCKEMNLFRSDHTLSR